MTIGRDIPSAPSSPRCASTLPPARSGLADARRSVGRIINPVTARSQFIGGMTMGIGMALHEHGVMDPRFGTIVNHDFADYHIPTCADIEDIDAIWLEEPEAPPGVLGARGLGEIGIVGAAAAIANAAYHATGVRRGTFR